MKVKELIEELSKYKPESEVTVGVRHRTYGMYLLWVNKDGDKVEIIASHDKGR